jgi:hypothetical protein
MIPAMYLQYFMCLFLVCFDNEVLDVSDIFDVCDVRDIRLCSKLTYCKSVTVSGQSRPTRIYFQ